MLTKAFKTLGVKRSANVENIRKAYVKLVRRYPPEYFPEKFNAIKIAYDQLTASGDIHDELITTLFLENEVPALKSVIFQEMVDESKVGTGLASLHDLVDVSKLVSPEELLGKIEAGPIEYRRKPKPSKS